MTDKDIQNYYKTDEGMKIKQFIEQETQDAVVCSINSGEYNIKKNKTR